MKLVTFTTTSKNFTKPNKQRQFTSSFAKVKTKRKRKQTVFNEFDNFCTCKVKQTVFTKLSHICQNKQKQKVLMKLSHNSQNKRKRTVFNKYLNRNTMFPQNQSNQQKTVFSKFGHSCKKQQNRLSSSSEATMHHYYHIVFKRLPKGFKCSKNRLFSRSQVAFADTS